VKVDSYGRVTVTWAARDAIEVAYVLMAAGTGADGAVTDRGFYDDGSAIFDVADSWLHEHEKRRSS
jgi:hypothetical protein